MTPDIGSEIEARKDNPVENVSYRTMLIEATHSLNASFDKLVVTLAGGALAVSIAFLKDIISIDQIVHPWLLLTAWCLFVASLACILGEILFGIEAYQMAIRQLDNGTIHKERPGKNFSIISCWLQRLATIALIVGLLLLSTFTLVNIGDRNASRQATAEQSAEEHPKPTASKS